VKGGYRLAAAVLALVLVTGPMWLAPRGQLLELSHNWWQASACVSYVAIALAYLAFFATGRPRRRSRPVSGALSAERATEVSHLRADVG